MFKNVVVLINSSCLALYIEFLAFVYNFKSLKQEWSLRQFVQIMKPIMCFYCVIK